MTHPICALCLGLFLFVGACAQGDVAGNDTRPSTTTSTTFPPPRDLGPLDLSPTPQDMRPPGADLADLPGPKDAGTADLGLLARDLSQPPDMAPPCGGRCTATQACRQGVCEDLCAKAAARCGSVTEGGDTVECGTCTGSTVCQANTCTEACAPLGLVCGSLTWSGQQTDCGSCAGGTSCLQGRCIGSGWRTIAAGADATCATRSNGEVRCWGDGATGQLGGGSGASALAPATVPGLGNVLEVDMESRTVCALDVQGQVWCWGQNSHMQIDDRSTAPHLAPSQLTALPQPVTHLSVATGHICTLDTAGKASCIGYNAQGQLGDGSRSLSTKPVAVIKLGGLADLELGDLHSCALELDGRVKCWGYNGGEGDAGRLGTGQEISTTSPTLVSQLPQAFGLSAGFSHTCAVDQALRVWCWGDNQYGQLGMSGIDKLFASQIPTLTQAVEVVAGYQSTCAIDRARDLWCWGRNTYGQLGLGDVNVRRTPQKVPLLNQVAQVDLGQDHTCATTLIGELWCWGRNHRGQLGLGDTRDRLKPVNVQ